MKWPRRWYEEEQDYGVSQSPSDGERRAGTRFEDANGLSPAEGIVEDLFRLVRSKMVKREEHRSEFPPARMEGGGGDLARHKKLYFDSGSRSLPSE